MKIGKTLAAIALLTGATALAGVRSADAQTLGWNSSISAACVNVGCTVVTFTQALLGLKPTDNQGNPVPAPILALGSPGYIESFSVRSLTGAPHFTSGTILGGSTGWRVRINNGALLLTNQDGLTPWDAAPVTVQATLDATALGEDFSSSGTAHLDAYSDFYNAAGVMSATGTYNLGTFNNNNGIFIVQTVTPEPGSMTLLLTGVVGLVGVVRRRRKTTATA